MTDFDSAPTALGMVADARPARAVATALVSTIVAALPAFLFGGLAALVRRDLGFGVQGIGVAVAGYFAVSALASIPAGRIGERIGARRGILGGAFVSGATLLAMGAARSGWQLGIALACGGIGNALIQPAANLLLTQHVPAHRRGLAFGIKQSAIPASALLGGLAVATAGETLGWRGAFVAGAGLALVVPLLTPQEEGLAVLHRTEHRHLPHISGGLLLLAAAAGVSTAAANSMSSYVVEYGIETGLTPASAGFVLMAGSAAGLVSRVVIAWQSDHRPGEHLRVVAVLMGTAAIGYLVLAASVAPALLVVGALVAFMTGWGWNALFIYSVVRLHPTTPAASTGVTMGGGFSGSVFGPAAFGYIVGALGFRQAWTAAALCAVAAAVFIVLGRRRIRHERGGPPGPGVVPIPESALMHQPERGE
ncbi:MAG: MFS transporter [Nitriliruptorales bacterium]|nr:MFS transporter [Nitriliruptorales bacterium]